MKTIKISRRDEQGGLNFNTVSPFIAYEMELSGKVIFLVSEGTNERIAVSAKQQRIRIETTIRSFLH